MEEQAPDVASIDWAAVAKALGVSLDTLPAGSSVGKAEKADAGKPVSLAHGFLLTDEEWQIISPHVPRSVSRAKNDRGFLDGVIWRERMRGAGRSWWYIPQEECGGMPVSTMRGRFLRWCEWGWWETLAAKLESEPLSERRKCDFRGIAIEAARRREKVLSARRDE